MEHKVHDIWVNRIYPVIESHISFADESSLAMRNTKCHTTVTDISIIGYLICRGQMHRHPEAEDLLLFHRRRVYTKLILCFLLFI